MLTHTLKSYILVTKLTYRIFIKTKFMLQTVLLGHHQSHAEVTAGAMLELKRVYYARLMFGSIAPSLGSLKTLLAGNQGTLAPSKPLPESSAFYAPLLLVYPFKDFLLKFIAHNEEQGLKILFDSIKSVFFMFEIGLVTNCSDEAFLSKLKQKVQENLTQKINVTELLKRDILLFRGYLKHSALFYSLAPNSCNEIYQAHKDNLKPEECRLYKLRLSYLTTGHKIWQEEQARQEKQAQEQEQELSRLFEAPPSAGTSSIHGLFDELCTGAKFYKPEELKDNEKKLYDEIIPELKRLSYNRP